MLATKSYQLPSLATTSAPPKGKVHLLRREHMFHLVCHTEGESKKFQLNSDNSRLDQMSIMCDLVAKQGQIIFNFLLHAEYLSHLSTVVYLAL